MKNNVRIYFRITIELYEKLKKEASAKNMSIAQLCRDKLKTDQFDKIFFILEKLVKEKAN